MYRLVNKVILEGLILYEPSLIETKSGSSMAKMRLSVKKDFRELCDDRYEFIDIIMFKEVADYMLKYGKKSRHVFVDGRLRARVKNGKSIPNSFEVVANSVRFLDYMETDGEREVESDPVEYNEESSGDIRAAIQAYEESDKKGEDVESLEDIYGEEIF